MSGDNGRGALLRWEGLPAGERGDGLPAEQAEQLLDRLADRLGNRLEGALQERLGRDILPRLAEMESKMEDLTQRVTEVGRPLPAPPVKEPFSQQELQRQARSRVD